jgi:hypothetical protein
MDIDSGFCGNGFVSATRITLPFSSRPCPPAVVPPFVYADQSTYIVLCLVRLDNPIIIDE